MHAWILIILFFILILIFSCSKESMMDYLSVGVPNINYDSGVGVTKVGQEWTQPGMIGPTGYGLPYPEGEIMTKLYDKLPNAGGEYVRNQYDFGNIFHIPNSFNNASDTTEDDLFRFTMERSRFSDNNNKMY